MTEITTFCRQHAPCRDGEVWLRSQRSLADAYDKCPRGDWLLWGLRKVGKLTRQQSIQFACDCAERVLPLFEIRYPDDKRPRAAIKAARKCIADDTEENRQRADAAARAAYAASDAAAAAYAAAYAAYAAARAAYADAADYAADAAANAAYAAAYAAAERKWQADRIREIVGENPFRKG